MQREGAYILLHITKPQTLALCIRLQFNWWSPYPNAFWWRLFSYWSGNSNYKPYTECLDHLNKLISIRAGSNIITVTLPDLDAVPHNTIIPLETTILNSWQATIATQGGQYIYMRNSNYTSIYMGISESLWLYRGDNGWYVLNDFAGNYDQVGKIQASYKVGLNEVLANGPLYLRAAPKV